MNCKLCANYLQLVFELCAISEQIVCKHRHTDKNTSCCTSRVAFMAKTDMPSPVYCASVHKTSILYKCIQNQFTVQLYTKPVYCTSVHKTSLLYKCTQNQFTHITSLHTKPVHCANVYMNRIECLVWNVHGRNISYNVECTWTEHYIWYGKCMDRVECIVWNVHGRNIMINMECTRTEHYD